jgi:peroxiredoxin
MKASVGIAPDLASRGPRRVRSHDFTDRTRDVLRATGVLDQALHVGDVAPDFTLPGVEQGEMTLSKLRSKGPVVVIFYRGQWCSICMRQLRTWQAESDTLQQVGASLVAISPDTPETLRQTRNAHRLSLSLLSDPVLRAGRAYNVAMSVPPELVDVYRDAGADAAVLDEDGHWELPVPATFVVGSDGRIALARIDLEGSRRTRPGEVMPVLLDLAAGHRVR